MPAECIYCYVPDVDNRYRWVRGELRLDERDVRTNLGTDKTIFVGSTNDVFAETIPADWIEAVLKRCSEFPENSYLFQTKNPKRFNEFLELFPPKSILGTTIETNRLYDLSKAPQPYKRALQMEKIDKFPKMASIGPILDLDLKVFVSDIRKIKPVFVSIGADSKRHGLDEPDGQKIIQLIKQLEEITEVKVKSNLKRPVKGYKFQGNC